jgi:hypothetical protein
LHTPAALQVAGGEQTFAVPGVQIPFWQLSFSVQAVLSALQAAPFGFGSTTHVFSAPQTAWWH